MINRSVAPESLEQAYFRLADTLAEVEFARKRSSTLARTVMRLIGTLDEETLLTRLGEILVPQFCDWAAVDLINADDVLTRRREFFCENSPEVLQRWIFSHSLDQSGDQSGEMQRTVLETRLPHEFQRSPYVALVLPLVVHRRPIGVVTLVSRSSESRIHMRREEINEILEPAAIAFDHARLFHEYQNALRLRDEFLSIASHELKNPLTTIRLQMGMLKMKAPEDELSRSAVAQINRQTAQLVTLVDELLDVSRIRAGKMELTFKQIDLGQLLRETFRQIEPQLEEGGIEAALDIEGDVSGQWDSGTLERVALNLISNAIKYGEKKPIRISVSGQGSFVVLSVRDHGMGIAPEDHHRVFNRFERTRNAPPLAGLGLGLYIVKQIVDAHGGKIDLQSKPGEGSTFTVTLPRKPCPPQGVGSA